MLIISGGQLWNHWRHARAVMHVGIVNKRFLLKSAAGENIPGIPGACATRNFAYLVRGPWLLLPMSDLESNIGVPRDLVRSRRPFWSLENLRGNLNDPIFKLI